MARDRSDTGAEIQSNLDSIEANLDAIEQTWWRWGLPAVVLAFLTTGFAVGIAFCAVVHP